MTQGAAEHVAGRLRGMVPSAGCVPVDPYDIARQLGITEIAYSGEMLEDGRLERDGGHLRVTLATRGNDRRRRFTLAHEIGHLLLADPGHGIIARRMRTDDEVERFCDSFAAALLLPRPVVVSVARGRTPTLQLVRDLGDRLQVSMAAVTVRLAEVCCWDRSLLHWKRSGSSWTYRWGAAVPRPVYRTLKSSPTTSSELDALAAAGTGDQIGQITMRAGSRDIDLAGEFSVFSRSAIGLARLLDRP